MRAVLVAALVGLGEPLTSGARCIVAIVVSGVAGVGAASPTRRVASTWLAVFGPAAARVVFAAVGPDTTDDVVCFAGGVASVESGSDPPAALVAALVDRGEPVGELRSAPPVLTTTSRSAEVVGGCDDPDGVDDADYDVA